jgi:acyl carrier protein
MPRWGFIFTEGDSMQREEIRATLKAIFEEETGEKIDSLPDDTRIVEELGLDSVDVVSLIMRVEQQFRVRISHAELAHMTTAGSLLDIVQAKVQSGGLDSHSAAAA